MLCFFFFKQKTAYEMRISDWSSDVCSSDLLCLQAPAAGRYSVALYHDENGNKEFDKDFLGIPSEGYGFSKNPGFRFGVPKQEETLFAVEDAPVSLRIAMQIGRAHV